ncbi:MAG: hypothetical protein ACI9QV_000526 [Methylophagaceae bacterium]|jgi:hypothetical protein
MLFKRFFLMTCLMGVALPSVAVTQQDYQLALGHWAKVLGAFVNAQGQTDFIALAKQTEDLQLYVDFVAQVSPQNSPSLFQTKSEVLAYHINAYNALAMHSVIAAGIPSDFNSFFKRLRFFKLRDIQVGGESTSLYDYENDVIRLLGEPRIHFVLNCMVKDCPRLPKTVFVAEALEQDLMTLTHEFFNKDRHLRFDDAESTVLVSEILDFYTEDFVASRKTQDLLQYINQFREEPIPAGYRMEFIDYDWTINQQP